MAQQTAANLRAAADVLERDGWTQGNFRSSDGCRCASGAIAAALQPDADVPADLESNLFWSWCQANDYMISRLGRSLASWNDDPGRTAAEVIAALRAAADRAEATNA